MHRKTLFLGLALLSAVIAGAVGTSVWTRDRGTPGFPAAVPDRSSGPQDERDGLQGLDSRNVTEVLESLTQVLDDEINERRVLAEKIEALDSELSELKLNLKDRVEEAFEADNVQRQPSETVPSTMEERRAAMGLAREHLAAVDRIQAEAQMAAIELDDRARREGWVNTPRYYEEGRELASAASGIRDTLGDELYDRYLFASGMPNRIAVGSIIETSPAEQAGFRPGDVIVRYGGENVYSTEQLVDLRSSGIRGEPVAVEILRDGRPLQLTVPRGPMGISTAGTVVDPTAPPD